ncbi:MAG TPA: glutathionylspermidine synthase family protein [Verrucomicrobiales bacterium]|nr:glutathionylspermidine synthase family protein [Verrucomicrobiales bacterium]
MQRHRFVPRPAWQEKVTASGLRWHTDNGAPFWDESASYSFTAAEIARLSCTAAELHALCMEAIHHVIRTGAWQELCVSPQDAPVVLASWERGDFALYGRFDLLLDENGQAKFLEYNADTPTILLESSLTQGDWVREVMPGASQWNDVDSLLIAAWRDSGIRCAYFTWIPGALEEEGTVRYLASTAEAAGVEAIVLPLTDIGWHRRHRLFVDSEGREVRHCFKLYPWEWILRDPFALQIPAASCRFIEPAWKHLLSNKALAALLWKLFPDHPALVPCVLDGALAAPSVVRKPVYGREGCNVEIRRHGTALHVTDGPYAGRCVEQAFVDAPRYDGFLPLACVWMIGGHPAGLGIREEEGPVTLNDSRFVPHFIADVPSTGASAKIV